MADQFDQQWFAVLIDGDLDSRLKLDKGHEITVKYSTFWIICKGARLQNLLWSQMDTPSTML